jgi:hypothetical protein
MAGYATKAHDLALMNTIELQSIVFVCPQFKAMNATDFAAPQPVTTSKVTERILYSQSKGIDEFSTSVYNATPLQLFETERNGVDSDFVKDLCERMDISPQRMSDILGVGRLAAARKVAVGEFFGGSGGFAALGIAWLLGFTEEIIKSSTAPSGNNVDSAKWLGQWLEIVQPALGDRRAADLIETPTGLKMVAKLLGSIKSCAYQ